MQKAKINTQKIRSKKGGEPIVCLTAYDYRTAQLIDPHVDLILVGDSVGMTVYGHENTLDVTLDMMINHGKAVAQNAKNACVVVDMPVGTYERSMDRAVENAARIMYLTGCDAVKLEGGEIMAGTVRHIASHGIPVMGHIGLMPQSFAEGEKYRIAGKTPDSKEQLLRDARAIQDAGAFSIVIEGTVERVAAEITRELSIPTIGIGASKECDGQILVINDILGLTPNPPKFSKEFALIDEEIMRASKAFADAVKIGNFPEKEHTYTVPQEPALPGPEPE